METDKVKDPETTYDSDVYGLIVLIDPSNGGKNNNNYIVLAPDRETIDVISDRLGDTKGDSSLTQKEKDEDVGKVITFFVDKYELGLVGLNYIMRPYDMELEGYKQYLFKSINNDGKTRNIPCKKFFSYEENK